MAFIETKDGTQLYYRDLGPRRGRPLLFVASAGMPHEIWSYNLPYFLERGARVVVFDRRGHGRSEAPDSGYDIDTLASDLRAVIERLDLDDDLILVGHSLGGAEIIRHLGRDPGAGRARKAVLIAPTAPRMARAADYPQGLDPGDLAALETAYRSDFQGWIAANKRPFFTPETSDALVDWGARLLEAIPLYVQLAISRSMARLDLREDLRRLRLPLLLIHGELDQSVPVAVAEQVARLAPQVIFKRYPDAAHGVLITHAERVNREIAGFVGLAADEPG